MFDVGFTELLLLAVIGLLVLGPERLPKVARTLGGLTRKARSSWLNLKRSIDAEINAEELKKPIKKMQDDVRSTVDDIDRQMKKASESVKSTVTGKSTNSGESPASTAQSTGTSSAATGSVTSPSSATPSNDKKPVDNDQH